MADLLAAAGTGVGVGVATGVIAAVVAVATRATRTLHLAIGPAVVIGALTHLVLAADGRLPTLASLAAGMVVGALCSALIEPTVLGRIASGAARPVGTFVVGGILVAVAARTIGARTVRPTPLVDPGGLEVAGVALPGAALGALLVGVPLALLVSYGLDHSSWGARLRLVGGSPDAAVRLGIRPSLVRAGALALAGALGTVAALLAAPLTLLGLPQAAGLTLRAVAAALVARDRPLPALGVGIGFGIAEGVAQSIAPGVGADGAVAMVVLAALLAGGAEHARSWGRAW